MTSPFFTPPGTRPAARHVLDDGQQAALGAVAAGFSAVVAGAPGTGKTTTAVEAVAAAVQSGLPIDSIITLAPTRQSASRLRQLLSDRLDVISRGPLARTPHSLAFGLIGAWDAAAGRTAPTFISGPEQDRIIAELLSGHASGEGKTPEWPADIGPDVRATDGFRHELREVLMRAMEWGIDATMLHELAAEAGRPEWAACADVLDEYLQVTTMQWENALDPAAVVAAAVERLESADAPFDTTDWSMPTLLVVDDLQDFTEAGARLLDVFVAFGAALVVTGDPDATAQGFRGAEPGLLAEAHERWAGRRKMERIQLPICHRQPEKLRDATGRLTERIGAAAGFRHRRPAACGAGGDVTVAVLPSTAGEHSYIAHTLRRAHVTDEKPLAWRDMAVVVRSSAALTGIRRELAAAGVPTDLAAPDVPLPDEPAVWPFLTMMRIVLRDDDQPDIDEVIRLLTSRIGGADSVTLRRLRIALREQERASGGTRGSDALLVEAIAKPDGLAVLPDRLTGPARQIAAILDAARANRSGTAHELLWAMWKAAGVADDWQRSALGDDIDSLRADQDLDAAMRLFAAAEKYSEVFIGLGAEGFGAHIDSQRVAEDTLAARGRRDDAVTLLTASGAAGSEWDLVIVPAVQEGTWPNLTLRGSLLGAGDLVDAVQHRPRADAHAARREILDDELRTFTVATSRARGRLVVTAVRDEDATPSPFLDLIDPFEPDDSSDEVRPLTDVPRPLSLRGLTAALRASLIGRAAGGDPTVPDPVTELTADQCATLLADLAGSGVAGADPGDWYGQLPISSTESLFNNDQYVPVNPSQVEKFNECPLRWFLETRGGTAADTAEQSIGNIVHELAHEYPEGGLDPMLRTLDERLADLGRTSEWEEQQERRRAVEIVRKLDSYLVDRAKQLLGSEVSFETHSGRAAMRGRVDRVERGDDGGLVIVDLKTGKSKPARDEVPRHAQLGTYQAAVEAGAFDDLAGGPANSDGAKLVQLGTGKKTSEQIQSSLDDDTDPGWARQLLADTAAGMDASEFKPVVNEHCSMCPVRTSCPLMTSGELP